MLIHEPYRTPRAVESAIKAAAKTAAASDPSRGVNQRIQLEYFNRFLSRIFSEGEESDWVLKGGTGMLARISQTRSTQDIDLYRQGFALEQALEDLRRLATIDLGDHFRFEYEIYAPAIATEAQPYTEGGRVTFNIFIGAAHKGFLKIDLVIGAQTTAQIDTASPELGLDLPKLVHHPYRLYPVVDQIADKVCATMSQYNGNPSSREKDLVDLVVLAVTQSIDGNALRVAINTERQRRKMPPFEEFVVPSSWGSGYTKLSRNIPHCAQYPSIQDAEVLVARLINPALSGGIEGKTWSSEKSEWR